MSPQAPVSLQQVTESTGESHPTLATAELENALAVPETQATPENAENEETDQQVEEEQVIRRFLQTFLLKTTVILGEIQAI